MKMSDSDGLAKRLEEVRKSIEKRPQWLREKPKSTQPAKQQAEPRNVERVFEPSQAD